MGNAPLPVKSLPVEKSEETPDQAAQYIASLTQELAEIARRNGLDR